MWKIWKRILHVEQVSNKLYWIFLFSKISYRDTKIHKDFIGAIADGELRLNHWENHVLRESFEFVFFI